MAKKMSIFVLTTVVVFACLLLAVSGSFALASAEVEDCDLKAEYKLGETFSVPSGSVSLNGTKQPAESSYVVFPSGKANVGKSVTLSESGLYTVWYSATINNNIVRACKTFIVPKESFSYQNSASSATVTDDGLKISVAIGDTVTFGNILDLSQSTKETPFLRVAVNPVTKGTADVKTLKLRFTDIYDSSVYFEIWLKYVHYSWDSPSITNNQIYVSARGNNQVQSGLENGNLHSNDDFGTPVHFSMVGITSEENSQLGDDVCIYFDYAEKQLFVDKEIYSGGQNRMIIDLDDESYFPSGIWKGFTTGEVRMSVFGENYQASTANILITQLNGSRDFSVQQDVEAPKISLDSAFDEENIPYGIVGKPYKIMSATAFDKFDGNVAVSSKVYYKYSSSTPILLDSAEGSFVPTTTGEYVLEYSSADSVGNKAVKTIAVEVFSDKQLSIGVEGAAASGKTGEFTKLFQSISAQNGSGEMTYSAYAQHKVTGEKIEIAADGLFCPMSDGEYTIMITATDYVSTAQYSFDFTAENSSDPRVYDDIVLKKYYIVGAVYTLPTLYAYDFSTGEAKKNEMDIYVVENGGAERKLDSDTYIPQSAGDVSVRYNYSNGSNSVQKVYSTTAVDVGYGSELHLEKYFTVTSGTVTASAENLYVSYKTSKSATLEFVNPVQVKNFNFSFNIGEANKFRRIDIYLTDIVSGKQVKFTYRRSDPSSTFAVNDAKAVSISSGFLADSESFRLQFQNETSSVVTGSYDNSLSAFLDGSVFDGFVGNQAYLSISIEQVYGESELQVYSLNGQSFNNVGVDRFAPQLIVETNSGDRPIGTEVTFGGAFVYDTLNPKFSVSMTIVAPDGSYALDADGIALDGSRDCSMNFTIKLSQYGDYIIKYVYSDGSGKSGTYSYAITSVDNVAPTIELGKAPIEGSVNKSVKIAEAKVNDNLGENCTVAVYVVSPEGVYIASDGKNFVPTMVGTYIVRYLVFDESGNYTTLSYAVTVK